MDPTPNLSQRLLSIFWKSPSWMTDSEEPIPPISKLSHDILYEIFLFNAYEDPADPGETRSGAALPVTNSRISSHVCRMWRSVILRAPRIWARCINLQALDQKTDTWRNLVLQRSGTSPLVITSHSRNRMGHLACFLGNLFDKQWERIQHVDITLVNDELKHIIKHLTRPTDTMRTFRISEPGLSGYKYQGTLDLFSGHAPNLVCLDLPYEMSIIFPHKSPFIFNSNMRDLELGLLTTSSVLFDAFKSMPLLEIIALRIPGSETSEVTPLVDPPSSAKLKMPHLRDIYIYTEDGNLDVYAGFLERITPSPGCRLSMTHGIYTEEDYLLRYARPMEQVFKQFASSLHAVRNAQKSSATYPDSFKASSSDCEFSFYNGNLSMDFMLHDQHGPPIPIPLISRVLKLCGQFEVLGEIEAFKFDISRMGPDIVTEDINDEFHRNLQQVMHSLKCVTNFQTSKVNMGLLAPYFSDRTILPSLKHIDIQY